MPVRVSADHIAAGGGGFQPQLKSNFTLRMTPPGSDAGAQVVELAMHTFPFPKMVTEEGTINYMNSQRKYPGRTTYPTYPLAVTDYVDQQTAAIFEAWHNLVHDPLTGRGGLCAAIKKQGTLVLFAPDGSLERKWKLTGMWPKEYNGGDGSMDDATKNLITVIFCIDSVIPQ